MIFRGVKKNDNQSQDQKSKESKIKYDHKSDFSWEMPPIIAE
jgi:hypothetical protein